MVRRKGWTTRLLCRTLCCTILLQTSPLLAAPQKAAQQAPRQPAQETVATEPVDRTFPSGAPLPPGVLQPSGSLGDSPPEEAAFPPAAAQAPEPEPEPAEPIAPEAAFPQNPPDPPGRMAPAAAPSPATAASTGAGLLPGWNLVSLPKEPTDPAPSAVFAPLAGSFSQVFAYDACDPTDPWKLYDPADPAASDLAAVTSRNGLWIEATASAALPDSGTEPAVTTLHLCPGWNLIGYPAEDARPVGEVLAPMAGKWLRLYGFDPSDPADPWELHDPAIPAWANDLQLFRPGYGYWLLATVETDLAIARRLDPLVVALTAPADLGVVTSPTEVVGTVGGGELAEWTLAYRAEGEPAWLPLASGTGPASGTLAVFDPTLLLNGAYEIELTTVSIQGATLSERADVTVEGQQKIGHFTLTFRDLEIPLSGLPVEVLRTYDSRDQRSGDFGVGWTLELRQGSYRNNRKPGDGWQLGQAFLPCDTIGETRGHRTTIRLSDREIYRFKVALQQSAPAPGGCYAVARFDYLDGPAPATLAIVGNERVFWENGTNQLIDTDTLEVYEPRQVRLTTYDGRTFDLDLQQGVTRVEDLNGNALTITEAGITHTGGLSVAFERDAQGRIVRVTDAEGASVLYAYDAAGDLVAVTDREGNATRFTYDGRHGLVDILDPRGVRAIRNEYDAAGRLLRHTDAAGKTLEYTHDLAADRELVTDRLGHTRVLEYDDRGNVVREVDALGHTTIRTFDADDRLLSETDPLGNTTAHTYDAAGNLLTATDPLGGKTVYTYDGRGRVLTATDPRGQVTTNTYDAAGNLLTTTDPLGNVSSYTYDATGNLLTETDALGNRTERSYDLRGNVIREIDPLGHETTYTYDGNGNRLTETRTRTTSAGPETLVWATAYDRLGRTVSTTDPDGSIRTTLYDALGNVAETVDALGRRTTHGYDDLGRMTATTYPDGTTEQTAHDAENRRIAATDRAGRVTRYEYDAVGRLLRTIYPDGAVVSSSYDPAGRMTATTDARGNLTRYELDAAGRRTRRIDALGREVRWAYDAAGNVVATTDARGQTTQEEYDDAGRPVRTTYPDGTGRGQAYDALGRRISETDPAGLVTRFGYDALGRLTSVTDAFGQVTRYDYDELGNRTAQTDANGHTTRFDHDSLGRTTRRVLPLGAAESFEYDAAGNLLKKRAFNGAVTTYEYDVSNRLTRRLYPDGSAVSFTYTPTGRRATATDARGTTTYGYHLRDRLVRLSQPDGGTLAYAYDLHGNRTSMTATLAGAILTTTYAWDALNRLETVTDPAGQVYRHGYDENGNRASLLHPNGVETVYTYDALNRLRSLTTRHGVSGILQSYAYTLGPAGNRTRIDEHDGTVRSYDYDPLYRLTSETVTAGGALVYRNAFTYDPVGNRLTQEKTGEATATVAYAYDERDRLLSEDGAAWSWDQNGNLAAKPGPEGDTYAWDFEDRLVQVTTAEGTVVTHAYDADGNRVLTEVTPPTGPPVATRYLVDTAGPLSHVVAEITGGELTAYYVRGDDLLAVLRSTGTRHFHADGLGSIRALTDETGALTDTYVFTAFGELHTHTGTDPNAYLFAGEMFDPNSGFYYLRARWMDPGVGRFASMDLVSGFLSDPLTLHKYLYAGLDPVLHVDPAGLEFSIAGFAVNFGASTILRGMALGFASGFLLGGTDALLRGEDTDEALWAAAQSGLIGAALGPLVQIRFVGPVLTLTGFGAGLFGVVDALEQDNYPLAVFRGALAYTGAVAFFKSAPAPPPILKGRLGGPATRAEIQVIGDVLTRRGWKVKGGGGVFREEYIPGPGGGRKGSNWIDITAEKNGRTLRINTVDTRADGVTPTIREAAAAAQIRAKNPHDHLLLIPKHSAWRY